MAASEIAGFCTHCRVVYFWEKEPPLQDALCPRLACQLPLVRKPRGRNVPRYSTSNRLPLVRERKPLIMKPVQEIET